MSDHKNEASRLDLYKAGKLEERRGSRRPAVAETAEAPQTDTTNGNTSISPTMVALALAVTLLLVIAFFAM